MKIKLEWKARRYGSFPDFTEEDVEGISYIEIPFEHCPDSIEFEWEEETKRFEWQDITYDEIAEAVKVAEAEEIPWHTASKLCKVMNKILKQKNGNIV